MNANQGPAFEQFARDVSLPMFRKQDGFLGCVMFRTESEALVLTLWRDAAAVSALEQSPLYAQVVARIRAAGFMDEAQEVAAGPVHLIQLERWACLKEE